MNSTEATFTTLVTTRLATYNATLQNDSATTATYPVYKEEAWIIPFEIALDSVSLFFSLVGNSLLILSILLFKRLRRTESNYLILNLAVCDVISTIFGMPFSIVSYIDLTRYLFGPIGCKLVYPTMTYGINGSAFTLVCIAIERYTMITASRFHFTKQKLLTVIFLIHAIAIISVIPYSATLSYTEKDGIQDCVEKWNSTYQKLYTVILIVLQYGLPLPMMAILYSVSWVKIMKRNNKMIKVSEDYERKMAWAASSRNAKVDDNKQDESQSDQSSTSIGSEAKEYNPPSYEEAVGLLNNETHHDSIDKREESTNTSKFYRRGRARSIRTSFYSVPVKTGKVMRKIKLLRKPKYISQLAYVRHRQTIRTLKMFTTIVIVFAIFALPNQLIWVFLEFAPHIIYQIPVFVTPIFKFFTYLNAMTNCWVYFAFNSYFRRAYKKIFLTLFVCLQNCFEMPHVFTDHDTTGTERTVVSTSSGQATHETQQTNTGMQAAFNDMFQDHINNSDKYQHLYSRNEEEDAKSSGLLTPNESITHRLVSSPIANLINAITPIGEQGDMRSVPSPLINKLSSGSHKVNFLPVFGMENNSASRALTTNHVEGRKTASMLNLDHINNDQMVLRESIEKSKSKRRSSAAELRKISELPKSISVSATPQPKRNVFSFLSPRISKRSDAKAPVLETVAVPSIAIDDTKDEMFTISESVVQTATATINRKINRPALKSNFLSKIPPLVLPKPKIHLKSTSNTHQINNDIIPLLSRKEKLEQAFVQEKQNSASIDRRDSMKKLQDKRLVRKRSNSLEKRISRDFSSFDEPSERKFSVEIKTHIDEETSQINPTDMCTTSCSTKASPVTYANNTTQQHIAPPTTNTANKRKCLKRPDISALLQHTLSVPALFANELKNTETVNDKNDAQQTDICYISDETT